MGVWEYGSGNFDTKINLLKYKMRVCLLGIWSGSSLPYSHTPILPYCSNGQRIY